MKKIKLIMLGIMVIGTMAGCADKTEVSADIDVVKTTEAATEEETSVVEETTTIEETTVAEAATVEEVDDLTYNIAKIEELGIRESDAQAAAEFLDKINFGKIAASRCESGGEKPRYEIVNFDGLNYYLLTKDDTILQILTIKGELIITITEEKAPVTSTTTPSTGSDQSSPNGEAPVPEEMNTEVTDDGPPYHSKNIGSCWG